jgi:hypothetical protein
LISIGAPDDFFIHLISIIFAAKLLRYSSGTKTSYPFYGLLLTVKGKNAR